MGGRDTVEALVATLNAGDVDGMDDVFHEDAVMDWPQSGERIVGGDNRRGVYRAFPKLPTITPRRIVGEGDVWVLEATLDYGDEAEYQAVFARLMYYAPQNPKALDLLEPAIARLMPTYPENEKVAHMINFDWWADNLPMMQRRFQQWLQS